MKESQYIDHYLQTTETRRLTPGSYLAKELRGNALNYKIAIQEGFDERNRPQNQKRRCESSGVHRWRHRLRTDKDCSK